MLFVKFALFGILFVACTKQQLLQKAELKEMDLETYEKPLVDV